MGRGKKAKPEAENPLSSAPNPQMADERKEDPPLAERPPGGQVEPPPGKLAAEARKAEGAVRTQLLQPSPAITRVPGSGSAAEPSARKKRPDSDSARQGPPLNSSPPPGAPTGLSDQAKAYVQLKTTIMVDRKLKPLVERLDHLDSTVEGIQTQISEAKANISSGIQNLKDEILHALANSVPKAAAETVPMDTGEVEHGEEGEQEEESDWAEEEEESMDDPHACNNVDESPPYTGPGPMRVAKRTRLSDPPKGTPRRERERERERDSSEEGQLDDGTLPSLVETYFETFLDSASKLSSFGTLVSDDGRLKSAFTAWCASSHVKPWSDAVRALLQLATKQEPSRYATSYVLWSLRDKEKDTEVRPGAAGKATHKPPYYSGVSSKDITNTRVWWDSLVDYLDREGLNPLIYFTDFLRGEPQVWGQGLKKRIREGETMTLADIRSDFLVRYGDSWQDTGAEARKKLHDQQHVIKPQEDVKSYTQRFYAIIRECRDMSALDQCAWYISGLSSRYPNVATTPSGDAWTDLPALVQHARGLETAAQLTKVKGKSANLAVADVVADVAAVSPGAPLRKRKGGAGGSGWRGGRSGGRGGGRVGGQKRAKTEDADSYGWQSNSGQSRGGGRGGGHGRGGGRGGGWGGRGPRQEGNAGQGSAGSGPTLHVLQQQLAELQKQISQQQAR